MARLLHVSTSGYYKFLKGSESQTKKTDQELLDLIYKYLGEFEMNALNYGL